MTRIIHVEPPELDDCPTCGNCGEGFGDDRFYDNDTFMYLCRLCAVAVDPAAEADALAEGGEG